MRLGGPVSGFSDPKGWISTLRRHGYTAAYCPVTAQDDPATIQTYSEAAEEANVVIAEVGAWGNPLSPDEKESQSALDKCKQQLALADAIGARCCVNISGSRGKNWAGPDPLNLTQETFYLIVRTVRQIIDSVKPRRTYYTLETMQWMYPDSADSYLELMKAIDRKRFAVHFDPVNLVNSPQRSLDNAALTRECISKLGPHVRSCHGKDVMLSEEALVHLREVRPGLGRLDYRTFLKELDSLDPDTPLMLEHLQTDEEYAQAADYVRGVAKEIGVEL